VLGATFPRISLFELRWATMSGTGGSWVALNMFYKLCNRLFEVYKCIDFYMLMILTYVIC